MSIQSGRVDGDGGETEQGKRTCTFINTSKLWLRRDRFGLKERTEKDERDKFLVSINQ